MVSWIRSCHVGEETDPVLQFFTAVLEFDKNEILIDSLGGELKAPVWMYQAHLYALFPSLF
jgi:hypothetical protein